MRLRLDYENYNNNSNPEPTIEEYRAFVDWLSGIAASELRTARGNREQQIQALRRYYARGERANLTVGELVDFLGVSTPSILDTAGYTDEEALAAMELPAEEVLAPLDSPGQLALFTE